MHIHIHIHIHIHTRDMGTEEGDVSLMSGEAAAQTVAKWVIHFGIV